MGLFIGIDPHVWPEEEIDLYFRKLALVLILGCRMFSSFRGS